MGGQALVGLRGRLLLLCLGLFCAVVSLQANNTGTMRTIDFRHLLYWSSQQVDILLLDLREPFQYERGHIPSAHNLPMAVLRTLAQRKLATGDIGWNIYANKVVVLYGDTPQQAEQAQEFFRQYFGKRSYTLISGYREWLQHGYPVALGASEYQNRTITEEPENSTLAYTDRQVGPDEPLPPKRYKDRIAYRIKGKRQPRWTRGRLIRRANKVGVSSREIRKRKY